MTRNRISTKTEQDIVVAINKLLQERDAARECLSQMFYLITGRSPEWSSKFGPEQVLEDAGDAIAVLKFAAQPGVTPAETRKAAEDLAAILNWRGKNGVERRTIVLQRKTAELLLNQIGACALPAREPSDG